jgi:hypothetical protein
LSHHLQYYQLSQKFKLLGNGEFNHLNIFLTALHSLLGFWVCESETLTP